MSQFKRDSSSHVDGVQKRMFDTRSLVRIALTVALLAVSAQLAIPIGPVPITLQLLVLFIMACLLVPKELLLSVLLYLVVGAVGLPVFSGFKGGIGALFGPTGGFLLGFLIGAVLIAIFFSKTKDHTKVSVSVAKIAIMLAASYIFGWVQLMAVTGMTPGAAFAAGIAPFIVLDLAKGGFALAIAKSVQVAVGSLAGRGETSA